MSETKTTYKDQWVEADFIKSGDNINISIKSKALPEETTDDAVKRILAALKYKLENF